jgi:hypothetical protein
MAEAMSVGPATATASAAKPAARRGGVSAQRKRGASSGAVCVQSARRVVHAWRRPAGSAARMRPRGAAGWCGTRAAVQCAERRRVCARRGAPGAAGPRRSRLGFNTEKARAPRWQASPARGAGSGSGSSWRRCVRGCVRDSPAAAAHLACPPARRDARRCLCSRPCRTRAATPPAARAARPRRAPRPAAGQPRDAASSPRAGDDAATEDDENWSLACLNWTTFSGPIQAQPDIHTPSSARARHATPAARPPCVAPPRACCAPPRRTGSPRLPFPPPPHPHPLSRRCSRACTPLPQAA